MTAAAAGTARLRDIPDFRRLFAVVGTALALRILAFVVLSPIAR